MDDHAGWKLHKENGRTRADGESNKLDLRNEIQARYGTQLVPWFPWVFDAIDLPDGSHLLELGCGSGQLWQDNAARIQPGWTILLSDQAAGMVEAARSNLKQQEQMRFSRMSSQALPIADESFEAVLAVGLLDLVPDLSQVLSEAWRVLRPSGQFIATAGGRGHLSELEDLLKPFLPEEKAGTVGGNEERFGMENGERLLAPYFEEVVRSDYRDRMIFTTPQPILDYVYSEQSILRSMPPDQRDRFVENVRETLGRQGEIGVSVNKGIFVARKKVIIE